MKFKHKVYDHKRKVGFDFGSFGPNSLGKRAQRVQNWTLFDFIKNWILGVLWYAEFKNVLRFLYDRKIWKIFRRILLSRWRRRLRRRRRRRRRRPNTFSFRTLTLVKVNINLWNFNTRFMTIKGRLGLILGVLIPTF